jgi:hypothetical protein
MEILYFVKEHLYNWRMFHDKELFVNKHIWNLDYAPISDQRWIFHHLSYNGMSDISLNKAMCLRICWIILDM